MLPVRRDRRMTLITTFPYTDGVVISADSKEVTNDFKHSVLKVKPERMGNFDISIAGAGDGYAIDDFTDKTREFMGESSISTLSECKKLVDSELVRFRQESKSVGHDGRFQLIVAARTNDQYQVWKTTRNRLISISDDKPDMIGIEEYLYRHVAKDLYSKEMPVTQHILLSLRVLDLASRTSNYVGGPYSVVLVRKDGMFALDEDVLEQFSKSLSQFGEYTNRVLLACADTRLSSRDMEHQLDEFKATVLHLRGEYEQVIGARVFWKLMESGGEGYPIRLLSENAMVGLMQDGQVTVTHDPEQAEQFRKTIADVEKRSKLRKTAIGEINENGQQLVEKTRNRASDFMLPFLWMLRCSSCSQDYLSRGVEFDERKCPMCQGGTPAEVKPSTSQTLTGQQ